MPELRLLNMLTKSHRFQYFIYNWFWLVSKTWQHPKRTSTKWQNPFLTPHTLILSTPYLLVNCHLNLKVAFTSSSRALVENWFVVPTTIMVKEDEPSSNLEMEFVKMHHKVFIHLTCVFKCHIILQEFTKNGLDMKKSMTRSPSSNELRYHCKI